MDISPKDFRIVPLNEKLVLPEDPTQRLGSGYGNWLAESDALSSGKVRIESTNERILIGSATAPLSGIGIFLGKDGSDYEFRAGDPAGDYIHWDGSDLFIQGNFQIGSLWKTIGPTDDFQQALDDLNSEGGGILYLQSGTYQPAENLVGYPSVSIIGTSPASTVIDFQSGAFNLTYAGTNVYSTGTITSITSGVNVTGSGTLWLANASAGQYLFIGTRHYKIAAVTGNTTLVLSEGYTDDVTMPGAAYRICTAAANVTLENFSVKSSTGTGIVFSDALQLTLNNVISVLNNKGFTFTNVSRVNQDRLLAASNTSNGLEFTNVGQGDWESVNAQSNGGHGIVFNNVKTVRGLMSSVSNTSDGFNITTGKDIFLTAEATGNGGQGIEGVATSENVIVDGVVRSNISDGIKLTATCDNWTIGPGITIHDNGGYGINIAAATCDNNTVVVPDYDNNTSGNLNDLGTGTKVVRATASPLAVADGGTALSSIAAGSILAANSLSVLSAVTSTSGLKVLKNDAGTTSWNSTTGTGDSVMATAPTFITSITDPLLIGGTGTTSTLILRSTSGVGASGADIIFQTGNNGATEAMRILNSGNVGVGRSPSFKLDVNGTVNASQFIVASGGEYYFRGAASGNNFMKYDTGNNQDGPCLYGNGTVGLGIAGTPVLLVKSGTFCGIGQTIPTVLLHVTQASLGTEVYRFESTATNDDPRESLYHNRVATTDATVTTIQTFTVPSSTTYHVSARVTARRTGGSSGAAEDGAAYRYDGVFKNVAGNASVIGEVLTVVGESQAGWNVTSNATGATVQLRVTGATNNNITWHMAARVWPVSS